MASSGILYSHSKDIFTHCIAFCLCLTHALLKSILGNVVYPKLDMETWALQTENGAILGFLYISLSITQQGTGESMYDLQWF